MEILPYNHQACEQCGLSLPESNLGFESKCGQCLVRVPAYDKLIALFKYQPPLNHFISAFKFYNKLNYASLFGQMLARHLKDCYYDQNLPECIIPVPLHSKRLVERGYNQSVEIARPIAKHLKTPVMTALCQRVIATNPQSATSSIQQRMENLQNAFHSAVIQQYQHIALLDDVVTTGATVSELAKLLKRQGVLQVDVWCIARTIPHSF